MKFSFIYFRNLIENMNRCLNVSTVFGSSLIYKMSAGRERHKCDTSDMNAIRVWHECYTNNKSATGVKNFDFDSDTKESVFSHSYVYYTASERLQGEKQFHFKNYLMEMSLSHAKMRFKNEPEKLNFVISKDISKSYTRDCSCKWPCKWLFQKPSLSSKTKDHHLQNAWNCTNWDKCNIEDSIHEAMTIQQRIRYDKESMAVAKTPFKFKFSARSRIVNA